MDTINVHKNYYYSIVQNKVNLDNMVRISVDLELPNSNFNLYKFQKVNIVFVNMKNTVTNQDITNERLSGEWMIVDIGYRWNNGSMKQTIKAVRKELSKTKEELKSEQPPQQREKNLDNFENPILEPIKANASPSNSTYKIGDRYLIRNSNGIDFILTVTDVSDNGRDIKGTLKNKE